MVSDVSRRRRGEEVGLRRAFASCAIRASFAIAAASAANTAGSLDRRISGRQDVNVLEVLTAAAAVIAAITGLWNTVQIGRLSGRLDTLTAQVNAHVNAPGLHAH